MPWYRRIFIPGGTYFFTVTLEDRRKRYLTENIDAFRRAYACERHPYETIAIVVLPDHLHCVWTLPPDDHDFPTRWRLLKSHFSRAVAPPDEARGRRKGERGIWQRRYWEHAIRDDDDLERHVQYIHGNPVKHGLVKDADDWPHSSWHRWKRDYASSLPPLPDDWRPVGERKDL
jgi:putative transposase